MGRVRPRVVIVGAGFGGLAAARSLAGAPVDVTVVDRANFHTFQPLLYQVATAGLGADDIAHSVRGILHRQPNTDFLMDNVVAVDRANRRVELAGGTMMPYDWLVVAAGAVTNTFGVPGVDAFAHPLKELGDALALRNHVLAQFERAAADPSIIEQGGLTFVIVGGGPTGVELAGAFSELFGVVLGRDFPKLAVGRARVVLVEATEHLLGAFSARSRAYALARLTAMGVDVRLGATVDRIAAGAVHLAGGEVISTLTPIWVAGVRAHPLAAVLGTPLGPGGRVAVEADLSLPGDARVFVVGDLAAVDGRGGAPLPQVAQVAIQGGKHAARTVRRALAGRPSRPFRYSDRGTMATIGRNAAVSELPLGVRFEGRLAWLAWLILHLLYLVGFRNRLNVLVNWGWNYVTYDRGARLIVRAAGGPSGPAAGFASETPGMPGSSPRDGELPGRV